MKTKFNCYDNETLIEVPQSPGTEVGAPQTGWDSIITAGSFLPRLQLYGGNSDGCKEGKIGVGRFGIPRSKENIQDLTAEVNCLPICFRFKALRITPDGQVISIFNLQNPEFDKIKIESNTPNSGSMFGVEFLLWLPNVGEGEFVTFYLSSKSSRREAPNLRAQLGKAATLRAKFIKKDKFSWHSPEVTACSTPFSNLPDSADVGEQSKKFLEEKDSSLVKVTKEEKSQSSDRD